MQNVHKKAGHVARSEVNFLLPILGGRGHWSGDTAYIYAVSGEQELVTIETTSTVRNS